MKTETYTTSQCAFKVMIKYSKRTDGTYWTKEEDRKNENRKYEDFSASDIWDGGKFLYSEKFALNEAKSFIMEHRKNIIKAIIFYMDLENNKEVRLCKWTSRSQFKYMKKHTFAVKEVNGFKRVVLVYDTADFLSSEITERRVQTFTINKYSQNEPGEGENLDSRTDFAKMADTFLKNKVA